MRTPAPLALSALNLPESLHDYLDRCLGVITNTQGALRDRNEQRALGVVEALQHLKHLNRAEGDVLRDLVASTAQAARAAQGLPPVTVGLAGSPSITLDPWGDDMRPGVIAQEGVLLIAVTTDALLHGVTLSSQWPTDETGSPLCIHDGPLLVQEIVNELQREDEQGATAVHKLLDAAALAALDNGSQAVEYLA